MQLVMRRHRLEKGLWYKFKINARMVLDAEESGLLTKYRLEKVILTPGNVARDLRRAVGIAAVLTIMLYSFRGFGGPLLLAFVVLTFLAYHQIREEVRVNDLINGRDFKARSLLSLLQKEHAIRKMSAVFANVVAQARTWDEPEVIDLEPQPLLTVLEGDRAAA